MRGLGIRNTHHINQALFTNLNWQTMNDYNKTWIQNFKQKYYHSTKFLDVNVKNIDSFKEMMFSN